MTRTLSAAGQHVVGTYYSHDVPGLLRLDARDAAAVGALFDVVRPTAIYLPASNPNVDECELRPAETYPTNVVTVANVVDAANAAGAKLVYFSSDYVFDGETGSYREDDPANPTCEYGRQKLIAEHHVAAHARDWLVVRTAVVYGWERQGKNFVYRLRRTLAAGETLRVPVDQVASATYAPSLAAAVVELALAGAQGIFHVAGPEAVGRYELAREAAAVFGLNASLIEPVPTSELGQPARRPLNAGLRVEKAAAMLSTELVGYREGLRAMAAEAP